MLRGRPERFTLARAYSRFQEPVEIGGIRIPLAICCTETARILARCSRIASNVKRPPVRLTPFQGGANTFFVVLCFEEVAPNLPADFPGLDPITPTNLVGVGKSCCNRARAERADFIGNIGSKLCGSAQISVTRPIVTPPPSRIRGL